MGGNAFASLSTPRMPPEIYDQVLKSTHAILKQHYSQVGTPIQAPGKETYGDVDFLVLGALDPAFDPAITHVHVVAETIAKVLGAKEWMKDNQLLNFAVPWPRKENDPEEKYVQLDIHMCHSQKIFDWDLFHAAHGDLWNILGSTIRRFGITVSNNGMFVRIPEIEAFDRKKSMILLTDEPKKILGFLGLKEESWWKPFGSMEEMFEYAATCRMFWVKKTLAEDEAEGDVIAGEGGIEGQEGGKEGRKKLKHNDRQRMSKRPIFAQWIDEFIPKCREEGRFGNTKVTREEIQDEAFKAFDVQKEFEERRDAWVLQKHEDDLWRDAIKGCVPEDVEPGFRSASTKFLKMVIMGGEIFDGLVPQAAKKNERGFYDPSEVRKFVTENWKRAGEIGLARQQARAMENMKAKAAKKEELKKEELRKEEMKEEEGNKRRKLDGPA